MIEPEENVHTFQETALPGRILDSIADGIIIVDTKGIVTGINRQAVVLTEIKSEDAIGQPLQKVLSVCYEADSSEVNYDFSKSPAKKDTAIVVFEPKDGKKRIIEQGVDPIFESDGTFVGAVILLHDITESRRLLEISIRNSKLDSLGRLAGGIAHDFNNLLAGLYGCVEMARNGELDPEEADDYLVQALKTMGKARELTSRLITFANGGSPVKKTENLKEKVEAITQNCASDFNKNIRFESSNELLMISMDSAQIEFCLRNIIENAAEATVDSGDISVSLYPLEKSDAEYMQLEPGRYACITITDTGVGIKKEDKGRIFDPFFTTKQFGAGLGLSTAFSIIKKHGGTIEVESTDQKGASFIICLPLLPEQKESSTAISHHVLLNNMRVVIMDDDALVRSTLSAILSRMGCQVECVENGNQALERIHTHFDVGEPVDVAILDLHVPDGKGAVWVAATLRESGIPIKLYVSSGYIDEDALLNPKDHGFDGSIGKPFGAMEIASLLRGKESD